MTQPTGHILKATEAAKYLSCGVKKLRALEKAGLIQKLDGFTHLRFSLSELDRYIQSSGRAHPQPQQVQP